MGEKCRFHMFNSLEYLISQHCSIEKTILFVTHSVDEAIYLSDRVVFMAPKPSRIEKEFLIDMSRIRQRNNPRYGELTEEMLSLFEKH